MLCFHLLYWDVANNHVPFYTFRKFGAFKAWRLAKVGEYPTFWMLLEPTLKLPTRAIERQPELVPRTKGSEIKLLRTAKDEGRGWWTRRAWTFEKTAVPLRRRRQHRVCCELLVLWIAWFAKWTYLRRTDSPITQACFASLNCSISHLIWSASAITEVPHGAWGVAHVYWILYMRVTVNAINAMLPLVILRRC